MPELIDVAPGSPEWMAARRAGVTATDIVTICGLSSTDSAYALYYRKLGVIPEPGDSDRWRLGRELEPIIAQRWREEHEGALIPGGKSYLYRSSGRPWQMATIDRPVWSAAQYLMDAADSVLELKSWADAGKWQWDDGPPSAVRAQVLWQMDVMGVAAGHVGVLFLPSGEFRSHVIEHENGCTGKGSMVAYPSLACSTCDVVVDMREAGQEFMLRMVNNDPPSPDGSAATLAALKARFPDARNDKTAPIDPLTWEQYTRWLDLAAEYKGLAKGIEAEIRELIGEAGVIEVDGEIVARRQRYPVKAHQRKASMVDKITRVKRKDNDDAE